MKEDVQGALRKPGGSPTQSVPESFLEEEKSKLKYELKKTGENQIKGRKKTETKSSRKFTVKLDPAGG